ncbi:CDP-glycerol glycerophosphotransferase family protein [Luedemannella flava]
MFTALGGRGYLSHPAAVHRAATRLAPHVRGVVAVRRDARAAVPHGVPTVVIGGFAWHRAMARARWLLSDTPLGVPARVTGRRTGRCGSSCTTGCRCTAPGSTGPPTPPRRRPSPRRPPAGTSP